MTGSPYKALFIRFSDPHLAFVRNKVAQMINYGLVMVGSGPWTAPSFAVSKPHSTKLHLVVNYKGTNAQTVCDSMPLPCAENIVQVGGKHHVFWKLDLKSGFW